MIVKLADWIFEVDVEGNMIYSFQEEKSHCTCGFCRNFYSTVDDCYPEMRPFLAEFGIAIEAPEELIPKSAFCYEIAYRVIGSVVRCGREVLNVSGLIVDIQISPEDSGCFWITFENACFPWVLDEAPENVQSPFYAKSDYPLS